MKAGPKRTNKTSRKKKRRRRSKKMKKRKLQNHPVLNNSPKAHNPHKFEAETHPKLSPKMKNGTIFPRGNASSASSSKKRAKGASLLKNNNKKQ